MIVGHEADNRIAASDAANMIEDYGGTVISITFAGETHRGLVSLITHPKFVVWYRISDSERAFKLQEKLR